jgi:3-phosphoshikimate 1-carboxyvinyltransferase
VTGARPLRALEYRSPVASAQVKSALLLAGLWADGPLTVEEPATSRDHTERMLGGFGVRVAVDGHRVTLAPGQELDGQSVAVPGDISSAAFFLAAALIVPDARVSLTHVGINPTRTGLLDVLGEMGAPVTRAGGGASEGGEPVADLTARPGALRAVEIGGAIIPRLIDEVPAIAVIACAASGVTRIRDAAELRVKESDRIRAIAAALGRMGADVTEHPDGLEIRGGRPLRGAVVSSGGDHRMAMAVAVAGLAAHGETVVEDAACIATSFPGFVDAVNRLAGDTAVVSEP